MKIPAFDELKTTQVAAFLLKLNNGCLSYMKLVKLIYNANREALKKWKRPITFDYLFSLPHGQIPSNTKNLANNEYPNPQFWNDHIIRSGNISILIKPAGIDELSRADISLLSEVDKKYKNRTQWDMEDEHHDSNLFPEWRDPKGSSILTEYETLFDCLNFSPEEIKKVSCDIAELAIITSI